LEFFLNPTFSKHTSHTTKRIFPWKIRKIPPSCLEKYQTFPSHATQKTTYWVNPHPKKIHLSQSLKKKPSLKKDEITPSSLPHPKKTLFKKKRKENLSSIFFKAPFTTCNFFNLIKLSTPYTY
jgi:hypothetical protein